LFGVGTFTARLPFALFGIATVFLTYHFTKYLFNDKKTALIAATLLSLSVPFLILTKQSRYYSVAIFFSLLGLYFYFNILRNKKYSFVAFLLSVTFLFHTHYIYCPTLLATVLIHAMIFHRDKIKTILILSASVVLINLPWIIWFSSMKYSYELFNFSKFIDFIVVYISDIMKFVFPVFLFIIPLSIMVYNKVKKKPLFPKNKMMWENIALLLLFIIVNLISLSTISPFPFFRYIAPLIPVVFIIMAYIIAPTLNFNMALGIVIVGTVVLKPPFFSYLYEITHDYDGPIEGITKFLNQNGNENDTVAVTYGDLPLKFYTNMRVIGGLTGEDLSDAKDANWIVLRRHVICKKDFNVRQYLLQNVSWNNYQKIVISYPDTSFENREDLHAHKFKTVQGEAPVVVYKKLSK
jgi:4-amino-4-deoxy-L-arabinose transferase-like glycosyltransferase